MEAGVAGKGRVVARALREDEAKAVHVLLAALDLGERAVRDVWLRHELPLGPPAPPAAPQDAMQDGRAA